MPTTYIERVPEKVRVVVEIEDPRRAERIAVAVSLLRYIGKTYGIEGAVEAADEAIDALQELTTEVKREGEEQER